MAPSLNLRPPESIVIAPDDKTPQQNDHDHDKAPYVELPLSQKREAFSTEAKPTQSA